MKKYRTFIFLIIIICVTIVLYLLYFRRPVDEIFITAEADTTQIEIEPRLEYGLIADSFEILSGIVRQNQNLSAILQEFGGTPFQIDNVVKASDDKFDFRKIRPGNEYHVFRNKDTLHQLCYFIYDISAVDYVMVGLIDSVTVNLGKKDVEVQQKFISGVIQTSLWYALTEKKANPLLAIELSEIFAWSIDFFGLQEGDTFKILYEELYVDTTSIGIGNILSAYMYHDKNPYYAIPFVQDSVLSFFDADGNSLRKAFLKAPLRYSRISSRFSNSRLHPILKIRRPHHGVDYSAPQGTPVYSVGDGKIIARGWDSKGGGNYVKIKHNGTYTTAYLHLKGFAKGTFTGQYVKQGDLIGFVGKTGLATGPHLDFRFYRDGKAIDPLKVEAPPVLPVHKNELDSFYNIRDELIKQLQSF